MKRLVFLLGIVASLLYALEPVRSLKAVNAQLDIWQSTPKDVVFDWREPFVEDGQIEYVYYFGQNLEGQPITKITKTTVSLPVNKDGVYYFRIYAQVKDQRSPIRTAIIRCDRTPPNGTIEYAASKDEYPVLTVSSKVAKDGGSPVMGVLLGVGADKSVKPDIFVTSNYTLSKVSAQQLFVRAALVDIAGNVSETKELGALNISSMRSVGAGKPNLVAQERSMQVVNPENGKAEVVFGSEVTYTMAIVNQGDAPAYDIEIRDVIPQGTILKSALHVSQFARLEYFDTSIGNGAWTESPLYTMVRSVRAIIKGPVKPGEKITIAYTVLVNVI